ncbi:hypothetical protein HXX76_000553 [Chlamydomonas incerta]|uniref:Uncharacterized protein n=1 Tax=Chlamydomonas incerta TaxID=51695 RepID=A0A835WF35_CHLIN|nr:hypothetical protein HXX76_000553 [Chlamydomonas incerta]|eukprot:KAG2445950.1 hypothetical protein HXX76_000553 [Chlamydomonas incerta]
MPPKRLRISKLEKPTLEAFAPDSSEEPDPIALALSLKAQGQDQAAAGKFAEARAALLQAVRLMPGNAELHELHAQVLLELGSAWEAVCAATRAVQLTPQWAEAHVTLARSQLNFGEPVLAEASYERALENLQQPSTDAAVLACVRQELAEARQLAERQRALGPGVRAVVKAAGGEGGPHGEEAGRGSGLTAEGGSSGGSGHAGDGAKRQRPRGQDFAGDGAAGTAVGTAAMDVT